MKPEPDAILSADDHAAIDRIVAAATRAWRDRLNAAPQPAPSGGASIAGPFIDEYDAKTRCSEMLHAATTVALDNPRIETNQATVTTLWAHGKPIAATTIILSDFNTSYAIFTSLTQPVPGDAREGNVQYCHSCHALIGPGHQPAAVGLITANELQRIADLLDCQHAPGVVTARRFVRQLIDRLTNELDADTARIEAAELRAATARDAGLEEAANLMGGITGEGRPETSPGYCARGWKIHWDGCPVCGATSDQNCPGDLFDAKKIATAIRALKTKTGEDR